MTHISPNLVLCVSVAAEGQWNIKASHRRSPLFNFAQPIKERHEQHVHTPSLFWNRSSFVPWSFQPNVWHLFDGHAPSCLFPLTKLFSWAFCLLSSCWSPRDLWCENCIHSGVLSTALAMVSPRHLHLSQEWKHPRRYRVKWLWRCRFRHGCSCIVGLCFNRGGWKLCKLN